MCYVFISSFMFFMLPTFKLERALMEKLQFKDFDGMLGILLLFGILKICCFVYVRINFISCLKSWRDQPTYFPKL